MIDLLVQWRDQGFAHPSMAAVVTLLVSLAFEPIRAWLAKLISKFYERVIKTDPFFAVGIVIVFLISFFLPRWPGLVGLAGLGIILVLKWRRAVSPTRRIWFFRAEQVLVAAVLVVFGLCNLGDQFWQKTVFRKLSLNSTIAIVVHLDEASKEPVEKINEYLHAAFAKEPDKVRVLPDDSVTIDQIKAKLRLAPSPTDKDDLNQFNSSINIPADREIIVRIGTVGDQKLVAEVNQYMLDAPGLVLRSTPEITLEVRGVDQPDWHIMELLISIELTDVILQAQKRKPLGIDQTVPWQSLGTGLEQAIGSVPIGKLPNEQSIRDIARRKIKCDTNICVHNVANLLRDWLTVKIDHSSDETKSNSMAAAISVVQPIESPAPGEATAKP
jgi:hypothetical protein